MRKEVLNLRLLNKLAIIIIMLLAGIFITRQVTNKNKRAVEVKPADKYQDEQQNEMKPLPSNVNKDAPELSGGSESSFRISSNNKSSGQILYSSTGRALKQVALTFDDGPDVYYTSQILDILKQNKVKATFFIIGTRAQTHPEMIRRIVREGHSIGNHTWNHSNLSKLSPERVKEEVQKTEQVLYNITGFKTAMFRPPYGAASARTTSEISSLGYNIVNWSVDTRDWANTPVPQIMKFVKKEVYPGGIILQHCAGGKNEDLSNTVNALPQIISLLRSQDYSFVTVQDLLNIPATK